MKNFVSKYNGPEMEKRLDRLGTQMPFASIAKKADYLYETMYGKLDYAKARAFFETKAPDYNHGACTAVRSGDFVGRNLDWLYSDQVDVVVHASEMDGQYASVATCSETGLDVELVKTGLYDDKWALLPFFAQDGINRYGVYANINVVPLDNPATVATIPEVEQRDRICGIMLVRYILDTFRSASEAVQYISDYVSVFLPTTLQSMGYESHWMVADVNNTYILEIIDNRIVVHEDNNVMTNFYIDGVEFKEDGTVYTNADVSEGFLPSEYGITPHGSGLERHNYATEHLSDAATKDGMRTLMNNLLFTNAYKSSTMPFWYSEYVGEGESGNVTVDTPTDSEEMAARVALVQGWYESRGRGDGKTWQTTHSCVYDLVKRKVYVVVQEDVTKEFVFGIPMFYTAEDIERLLESSANAKIKVVGETPFFIGKRCFRIGPSVSGYTVQTSATGDEGTFSDYSDEEIPADVQHELPLVTSGCWWRLLGNTGEVWVSF